MISSLLILSLIFELQIDCNLKILLETPLIIHFAKYLINLKFFIIFINQINFNKIYSINLYIHLNILILY